MNTETPSAGNAPALPKASPIYGTSAYPFPADKARQIKELARLGLAGTDDNLLMDLGDMRPTFCATFEIIARLADELATELGRA